MSYFRSFNHMKRAFLFLGERIPQTSNDSNLKSAYSFSNDGSENLLQSSFYTCNRARKKNKGIMN